MPRWLVGLQRARRRVLALGLALVWLTAATQSQPVGPEALVADFVRAWNAHDAGAFGELFSKDADWVTVSGVRVTGRAQIQAVMGKEHLTWARTTTITAADIEVRPIQGDLVVVFFKWEIVGTAVTDGKAVEPFRGNTLMVAAKQANRWIAFAGQAASTPPTR